MCWVGFFFCFFSLLFGGLGFLKRKLDVRTSPSAGLGGTQPGDSLWDMSPSAPLPAGLGQAEGAALPSHTASAPPPRAESPLFTVTKKPTHENAVKSDRGTKTLLLPNAINTELYKL